MGSKGARVRFSGVKRSVIDGPFAETKELVAGYWILQWKSLAKTFEWIKRCPNPHNEDSEMPIPTSPGATTLTTVDMKAYQQIMA